jgi:hypothetical protein
VYRLLLARGILQDTFVKRVAELEGLLDQAAIEDFSVSNDGIKSITDVARDILAQAAWV